MAKINFTPDALEDMKEIKAYITDELCSELAALAKRYGRMNWAAAEKIAEEDKEKKALKEKLRAEIKAELAAEAAKADGRDD